MTHTRLTPRPCPCCGVELVQRGDYTMETAWNWWQHPPGTGPDDDLWEPGGTCILKDIKLAVNWYAPSMDIVRWNQRVLPPPAESVDCAHRMDQNDYKIVAIYKDPQDANTVMDLLRVK